MLCAKILILCIAIAIAWIEPSTASVRIKRSSQSEPKMNKTSISQDFAKVRQNDTTILDSPTTESSYLVQMDKAPSDANATNANDESTLKSKPEPQTHTHEQKQSDDNENEAPDRNGNVNYPNSMNNRQYEIITTSDSKPNHDKKYKSSGRKATHYAIVTAEDVPKQRGHSAAAGPSNAKYGVISSGTWDYPEKRLQYNRTRIQYNDDDNNQNPTYETSNDYNNFEVISPVTDNYEPSTMSMNQFKKRRLSRGERAQRAKSRFKKRENSEKSFYDLDHANLGDDIMDNSIEDKALDLDGTDSVTLAKRHNPSSGSSRSTANKINVHEDQSLSTDTAGSSSNQAKHHSDYGKRHSASVSHASNSFSAGGYPSRNYDRGFAGNDNNVYDGFVHLDNDGDGNGINSRGTMIIESNNLNTVDNTYGLQAPAPPPAVQVLDEPTAIKMEVSYSSNGDGQMSPFLKQLQPSESGRFIMRPAPNVQMMPFEKMIKLANVIISHMGGESSPSSYQSMGGPTVIDADDFDTVDYIFSSDGNAQLPPFLNSINAGRQQQPPQAAASGMCRPFQAQRPPFPPLPQMRPRPQAQHCGSPAAAKPPMRPPPPPPGHNGCCSSSAPIHQVPLQMPSCPMTSQTPSPRNPISSAVIGPLSGAALLQTHFVPAPAAPNAQGPTTPSPDANQATLGPAPLYTVPFIFEKDYQVNNPNAPANMWGAVDTYIGNGGNDPTASNEDVLMRCPIHKIEKNSAECETGSDDLVQVCSCRLVKKKDLARG